MIWAFDADVIVYAGLPSHEYGRPLRTLISGLEPNQGYGSAILIPELLIKPRRLGREGEVAAIELLLGYLNLLDLNAHLAFRAVQLGARYGLKSVDAVHLATAIEARADRFLTNNRRDFKPRVVTELNVVFPEDL